MTKINLLLLISLIAVQQLFSQELNIKKGGQFAYSVHLTSSELKLDDEYTFSFKLLDKDSSGNYEFQCSLVKINSKFVRMIARQGEEYTLLNSDSIRNTTFLIEQSLMPLAILQKPFFLTVNPKGRVINIEGIENMVKQAVKKWDLKSAYSIPLLQKTEYYPKSTIQDLFFDFPDHKIQDQSEWLNSNKAIKYKVTEAKGSLLVIKADNAVHNPTAAQFDGLYQLNSASGLIETKVMKTSSPDNLGAGMSPPGFSSVVTQKLLHDIPEYPAADTSWIDMAVILSWMSAATETNLEYDSAKIADALKQYDVKFASDRYYNLSKLYLLQPMYKLYSKQLLKTPNHFLIGQDTHLHNKIGAVLDISADSAYAVSRYFYKSQNFTNWVQNSFSQFFLTYSVPQEYTETEKEKMRRSMKERGWSDGKIEQQIRDNENSKFNSFKLLELFNKDTDPVMQQKIHPLYLWVDAKKQGKNREALLNAAEEFNKMNETAWKMGNGGRYAILIYKLLHEAEEHKAAGVLLDYTIKKLESSTADTLNKDRYADQNMLAYAYFLKYQAEEKAGSADALNYLSKAAVFSPAVEKEKAYSSFYDRLFLGSQETYRNDFLIKLFQAGDNKRAMKVLPAHLSANPEQLGDLQKIYQDYYPGQSFKSFFTEHVLPHWKAAPDFSLTGIDNKKYTLADYKGSWLVLDFWGTWCSPCRREMPYINEFNQELVQNKYPGVTFLSIACHDTKDEVVDFLAKNNYSLPSVLSDNSVEKKYSISSYPSKVIVSPEGRMITINYGKDWKSIVRQFAELYKTQ